MSAHNARIRHYFYPWQDLSLGIVVSEKKKLCVRRTGGRAGGWASRFRFWTTVRKLTFIYEIWPVFVSYALVVPFGSHIAIAYVVLPFVSGPQLLWDCSEFLVILK